MRMKWNFHVDCLQKHSQYDIIIGQDLLSELQLDLCLSDYTIRVNVGAYERCTISMKDPYGLRNDASLRDEKLWKSEHIINATRHTQDLGRKISKIRFK